MLVPGELTDRSSEIKKLRSRWITALKDPDLRQTTGQLASYDYGDFCCLGVAEDKVGEVCGITREGHGLFTMANPRYHRDDYEDEYIRAEATLHPELQRALGLSDAQQSMLITLNDGGVSFPIIASVIGYLPVYIDGEYYD
jgi:hypothetical protein